MTSTTPSVTTRPVSRRTSSVSSSISRRSKRRSTASSSSASSIRFLDGDVEVVKEKGVLHAPMRLEARHYKSSRFTAQLLPLINALRVPTWLNPEITPESIKIQKVSGALTNAVFFVSCPTLSHVRTFLLRIYGPSSSSLISRPRELHILHILSSVYGIGPHVYGTFENGRLEEHFDSNALTPADLRDRRISRWIGVRMAELHSVDVGKIEKQNPSVTEEHAIDTGVTRNVRSWLIPARKVVDLPGFPNDIKDRLDLDSFVKEWQQYLRWVAAFEQREGPSRRVFAHNDTQYGNLLRLTQPKAGIPEHRQIIVVDFEYASPNPAAFDIANHFHEWTADYHSATPHLLNESIYPTPEERKTFYAAYLTHTKPSSPPTPNSPPTPMVSVPYDATADEPSTLALERQVRAWSPASHAMWAIWGLVQARESVESHEEQEEVSPDFDYVGYADGRMSAFRREIELLGVRALINR